MCGYDARSQLASINYTLGGNTLGNLTYAYDLAGRRIRVSGFVLANPERVNGRRVSKTIGGTTQYVYDGANPVQEISGTTASANLLTGGVDEYFQRTDSAGSRNYLTDALGSTLALADSTGTIQTSYTFEPFGNTAVSGASTTNSFAFTGREFDTQNLYFYRARYYSAQLQRFIAEDPTRFRSGQINLYGYVDNSPTVWKDPYGTDKGPQFPCIDANRLQRVAIGVLSDLSHLTGLTIGIGVGGTIGGGPIVIPGTEPPFPGGYAGGSISASRRLVVSPNGEAAIATSVGAGIAVGFGGYAGPQVSFSNATTPADLGGPFVGGGIGGGDIVGGGGDLSFGHGSNGQLIGQLNLTAGIGIGGLGTAAALSNTTVEPICSIGHLW